MSNKNPVEDRASFRAYCLRNLGEGALTVNVTDEQIDDRIDEALYYFYERHYNAVEIVYIVWRTTKEDIERGYLQLEPDIVAVTDVARPNTSQGLFSLDYQLQLQTLYNNTTLTNFGDMSYYYMQRSYMSLVDWLFSPGRQYDFNPHTGQLRIAGGLVNPDDVDGAILLTAYKKVHGSGDDEENEHGAQLDAPQERFVGNIWKERWLQDFATALIMRQWGRNMTKYKSVPMLGGVTLNGDEILSNANQMIQDLKDEMASTYESPIFFVMG